MKNGHSKKQYLFRKWTPTECLDDIKKIFFISKISINNWEINKIILEINPAGIYLLKVTVETLEQGVKYGIFIVNFEHISHIVLVFLLLTLNI